MIQKSNNTFSLSFAVVQILCIRAACNYLNIITSNQALHILHHQSGKLVMFDYFLKELISVVLGSPLQTFTGMFLGKQAYTKTV